MWFKRMFSAGLVLMLAVGMCACGDSVARESEAGVSVDSSGYETNEPGNVGGSDNVDTPGTGDTGNASIPDVDIPGSANVALAKENVYRAKEIAIPDLADNGNVDVESVTCRDGSIYAVVKKIDWENGNEYFLLFMNEDTNTLQTIILELPEDSEREETEPDPNVWQQEDIRYSEFVTGADGKVFALRQYKYSNVNNITGQFLNEQHQYVCCWAADGRLMWQMEPCGDSSEDLSVWSIFPAADGSLELLLEGENFYRLTMAEDGSLLDSNKARLSETTAKTLDSCRRLIRKEDGSCLLLCWNAGGSLSLIDYDLQTDTLGEALGLPDDFSSFFPSNVAFSAGMGSDLVYASRNGVFSYNAGDTQGSLKMNYVNSDRNITGVVSLIELDETHFFMFYNEDYAYELKAGIFEYVKPEDIPDKAVVVLGGLTIGSDIKKRAIQYNRESDRNRVVLKEYGSYEKLNLDIVSGDMPDILIAEGLPMKSYIEKGLIADVGMLIEKDGELSQTEFMQNVFDAYSVDGKLMYVVPSFTLSTMAAKTSLVGDGSDWSMERMMEVLDGMGSKAQLMDGVSRNTFIEKVMKYCGNDFIDVKTGKCAFDSQDFIEIMKFAYTLPEERIWAGRSGEGAYELQYLKNRTLLMELHIWTFAQNVDERLFYLLNGYLGGDYTLVGFPVGSENVAESSGRAVICAENLMALSARSENLDGAWDFARYYLTDEYQKSLESSLPVCRRIFEEWAGEETRRSCRTDEKGEKVEYDLTLNQDGNVVVVPPLDQEQLEELITYVESVTAISFEENIVINIVNEELGSYFSGQKTAEDVAAIIQNRVQMYVYENQ